MVKQNTSKTFDYSRSPHRYAYVCIYVCMYDAYNCSILWSNRTQPKYLTTLEAHIGMRMDLYGAPRFKLYMCVCVCVYIYIHTYIHTYIQYTSRPLWEFYKSLVIRGAPRFKLLVPPTLIHNEGTRCIYMTDADGYLRRFVLCMYVCIYIYIYIYICNVCVYVYAYLYTCHIDTR